MQVSKKLVKIQAVIDKLQNAGLYVQLFHALDPAPEPHGSKGFTVMQISKDEVILAQGIAQCAPEDSYNKTKGTQIAFGRMMRMFSETHGSDFVRELLNDGHQPPASNSTA